MSIFDVAAFINIERYAKINIRAKTPREVYPDKEILSVDNNIDFLLQIVTKIKTVKFVDPLSSIAYLEVQNGAFSVLNQAILSEILENPESTEILSALGFSRHD